MIGLPEPTLEALGRERPEWSGWLALLAAVRRAAEDPTWESALAGSQLPSAPDGGEPLLAAAVLTVEGKTAARFVRELLGLAARHEGPAASLRGAAVLDLDRALAVLEAAVAADRGRLDACAIELGAEPGALRAVAPLVAVPLLRAAARRWAARLSSAWVAGSCPVCASWPLLAEERGLERHRRYRCGRCACDWRAEWMRCPFCGNHEHERLGTLVSEGQAGGRFVSTCEACRGYMKTLTTLLPTPDADLALADLATVELDVAALERGYARPPDPARALTVRVTAGPAPGRRWLAGWR